MVITEFLFKLKLQLKLTCLKDCENTKREEKHWLHVDFAYHNWTLSTYWFTDKELSAHKASLIVSEHVPLGTTLPESK